jgi:hypothetical protein
LGEQGLTKQQVVQELARSRHGKLSEYQATMGPAIREDPEFVAHLIAWNFTHGQIRDSKVALPVLFLRSHLADDELRENALANLAGLDPRNLVRAVRFSKEMHPGRPGYGRAIRRLIERYLRVREENWSWWERTAVQHRASLKTLYALNHVKPSTMAEMILFKRMKPKGTIFHDIACLKGMSPTAAAGTIMKRKIPFLVAFGALGEKMKHEDTVLALIGAMSPTELTTNVKLLEKLGVKDRPALRAAFEEGLKKAAKSKKTTLKAGRAAKALGDSKLAKKMEKLQEDQIDTLKGIEGDWLVLGDKSGSMATSIRVAAEIAGVLSRFVKGKVHLVFFDTSPRHMDVTGLTLEEIKAKTKHVRAAGATSIGCGLQWALDNKVNVDGIAIVSDLGENNTPQFAAVFPRYREAWAKDPPVYLYSIGAGAGYSYGWTEQFRRTLSDANIAFQEFDLGAPGSVDYYSLPNLVQTMRSNRYSLIDEIMEVPLLKLEEVLKKRAA